jgi:undecaprenyl diphosphate synthase
MHISFIMDGNRRWAKQHMLHTLLGHQEGRVRVEEMIELCFNEGVEYGSFWAIAKKNIENRSQEELTYLFQILLDCVENLISRLIEKSIRFDWVGNPDILPENIVQVLNTAKNKTKQGTKMTFILAIGYG